MRALAALLSAAAGAAAASPGDCGNLTCAATDTCCQGADARGAAVTSCCPAGGECCDGQCCAAGTKCCGAKGDGVGEPGRCYDPAASWCTVCRLPVAAPSITGPLLCPRADFASAPACCGDPSALSVTPPAPGCYDPATAQCCHQPWPHAPSDFTYGVCAAGKACCGDACQDPVADTCCIADSGTAQARYVCAAPAGGGPVACCGPYANRTGPPAPHSADGAGFWAASCCVHGSTCENIDPDGPKAAGGVDRYVYNTQCVPNGAGR